MFQLNKKIGALLSRVQKRYASRDEELALQASQANRDLPLQPVNRTIVHDLGWMLAFLDIPLVIIRNAVSPIAASDFFALGISGLAAASVSILLRFGLNARWGAILLVSNTFLLIAYFAAIKGGLSAPILAISPIVPVYAALVLGLRAGWLATAAVAVGFALLNVLSLPATALTVAVGDTRWDLARGVMLFSCCVVLMLAAWAYERRHRTLIRVLKQRALEDSLTGLANRRALDERLVEEFQQWSANKALPISIIIFDIDNFKTLNDNYGHQAGDAALSTVAAVSRQITTRKTDFIGRYGGDEFIVILPGADVNDAMLVAKRIQTAIRSAAIEVPIGPSANDASWHKGKLTLSIGVATTLKAENADPCKDLLARADSALYEAKRNGRNQIVVAETTKNSADNETFLAEPGGFKLPEVGLSGR